MKRFFKLLNVSIIILLLFGCNDLLGPGTDGDPNIDPVIDDTPTYADEVINEFISEISTPTRGITPDIERMRTVIKAELKVQGLEKSTSLSALIPVVASSAQVSLNGLGTDDEKIILIKKISVASVVVVSKKATSASDEEKSTMVSSVTEAMVEKITKSGISAAKIEETTKETVSAIISNLGAVITEEATVLSIAAKVTTKATVAITKNTGVDKAMLESAISNLPLVTSKSLEIAVKEVTNEEIDDDKRTQLFKSAYSAVTASVSTISTTTTLIKKEEISSLLVKVQEVTSTAIKSDESFQGLSKTLDGEMLKESLKVVNSDEAALAAYKTQLSTSQTLEISTGEIENAENVAKQEQEQAKEEANGTVFTTAELEQKALAQLKYRNFSGAYNYFQKAYDNGDASENAKLWWAVLTVANISTDSKVRTVASNLGIENYPSTLNEFFIDDFLTTQYVRSSYDNKTWNDETKQYDVKTYYNYGTMFSHIKNQEMFNDVCLRTEFVDGVEVAKLDVPATQTNALFYNLQLNYPEGLNSVYDSVVEATSILDSVETVLASISETASFKYTYDMFYTEVLTEDSNWPKYLSDDESFIPAGFIVGKAEVLGALSVLELFRSVLSYGQAVSLNTDIAAYWTFFNPLNGSAFKFDPTTKEAVGISESFDLSTVKSPFADGFLFARDGADSYLAESKGYFKKSLSYLNQAFSIVKSRKTDSPFSFAPYVENSNPSTDKTELGYQIFKLEMGRRWEEIVTGLNVAKIMTEKMIYSLDNNSTVYFPGDLFAHVPYDDNYTSTEMILSYYSDVNNWPTADNGTTGFNLGKLFVKPIFAIDNLIQFNSETAEPAIYTSADMVDFTPATDFNESNTYFIRFMDITFGGLITGFDNGFESDNQESFKSENSMYLKIPDYAAFSVIKPKGDTYTSTVDGTTYTSTGSIFGAAVMDMINDDKSDNTNTGV